MSSRPILYDPDCGFCQVCVALVLRWDRQGWLRPVPLGSEEANTLLADMPEEQRMASWHLVGARWWVFGAKNATNTHHLPEAGSEAGPEEAIWSGGAAFSPLFRLLPGGAPLAWLAERFPRAAERGYRWVAEHRSAFGRPLPGALRRWADRVISESRRAGR
jgi:predicted DCC family thiol-disulfide oxidoreductase YuxK